MRQTLGSGSPRSYAAVVAGLWIDLRAVLRDLDALAADPELLLDERDSLPALQYELHCAGELAAGLTPPDSAELEHDELIDALAGARELTSEISEALERGGAHAAAPLVWEWRGALFRVRFARLRLERPQPLPAPPSAAPAPKPHHPPALTVGAVAAGSALVLFAALLGLWLLVALTLAGTLAASVLLHP
ncbi:MAG: hypothetical protein ACYDA3_00860 [Gaiellaceae bacterium]